MYFLRDLLIVPILQLIHFYASKNTKNYLVIISFIGKMPNEDLSFLISLFLFIIFLLFFLIHFSKSYPNPQFFSFYIQYLTQQSIFTIPGSLPTNVHSVLFSIWIYFLIPKSNLLSLGSHFFHSLNSPPSSPS